MKARVIRSYAKRAEWFVFAPGYDVLRDACFSTWHEAIAYALTLTHTSQETP